MSDGHEYIRIRERLVYFFARKGFNNSDDLADETLNRVARRLDEEGAIETEAPAKYCYIVARFVFHESLRSVERKQVSLDEVSTDLSSLEDDETLHADTEDREAKLECLERCVGTLNTDEHDLISKYYFGQKRMKIENRRLMAQEANISLNALSIRAFRIRKKLEDCLNGCLGASERN